MTVELANDRILLKGRCGVEEAELLRSALMDGPSRVVVLEAEKIHTALWQVLIAFKPPLEGKPKETFILQHVLPLVIDTSSRPNVAAATTAPSGDQ